MKRYKQLVDLVRFAQPATIIEIGTNKGARAELLCREALRYRDKVHYTGYDLFEDATRANDAAEMNGKAAACEADVAARLSALPGVTFDLVRGNTKATLHGTEIYADLVFIDGGHSVETIRGDYEAVKGSNVIAFDDYYASGADTTKFGCNQIVDGLPHEILPRQDRAAGMTIQLAVVGYSSKWAAAFDRIRQKDTVKSVAIWRPGLNRRVDMIAVINSLEPLIDPSETLEHIRSICKRMFFVIKADALRSLDWWRTELEKRFQVNEWFGGIDEINGPTSEVCGTAAPLYVVGELPAKGVMAEEERFEHTRINCPKVAKRLDPVPIDKPHGNLALIVCYGPSLVDTWTDLVGQLKFHGGDVFSVSGAHDFIMRRDIVPKYHVECDPREHKTKNINRPNPETEYLIASCCHPSLVDHLIENKCNVTLWHMCNGQESFRTVDELEPDQPMIHGGGNAGLRAIAVAYNLGYRHFVIYGMDCSFKGEQQWAGRHAGKPKKTVQEYIVDGEKFASSPIMAIYARQFFDTVEQAVGATFHLAGHGLLQAMVKASNKQRGQERAA